jgi:tetratricopeptide (TPR) repeat protein
MENVREAIVIANQQALAFHQQGQNSEAADAAAWAYSQAVEHLPSGDDLRRRITMNAAALTELAGNGETALVLYTEAMAVADELGDAATLGQTLDRLFAIHRQRNEHEAAVLVGDRSLALWRARHEPPTDVVLTFMNNLAQMHFLAGAIDTAATLMEEAIGHRQLQSAEGTPALALAFLNLGTVRKSQGDSVSAESHMLSALSIRRRLLPPEDPAIADALQHLSDLYASQKDYRRAIPYEEEILAVARRRGSESLELARSLNNLATVYYLAGEVVRSRPLYEEALAIVTHARGEQHPDAAVAKGNLANVLRQLADFNGAERLLRDVIATRRALLGDLHTHVGVAIDDLTDLFQEKESPSDLERFYQDVLAIVLRYAQDDTASTSRLLQSLQKIERALAALAPYRPQSLAQEHAKRLKEQLGPLLVANLMYALKQFALAAAMYAEAIARAPRHTHDWSLAMVGLAASFAQIDDLAQAERVCDDYIAAVNAGWPAPADEYASMLWTKSQAQEVTQGPNAAVATMRASVAQRERARLEGGSADVVNGLLRLSELHLAAGEFEAANDVARRVLEAPPATVGALTAARARVVLAHVAQHEGGMVEAESLFRAALPPMLEGEATWRTAILLRDFGLLYAGLSDAANGVPLIRRAVAMAENLHGKRSWQYAMMLVTLGEVVSGLGPVHDAPPLFVEVSAIASDIGSTELLARALRGSGSLYTRIGASDAAEDLLRRALTLMKGYSAAPTQIAHVETDLAMAEARLDKYDAACERIDRALTTLREAEGNRAWFMNATTMKTWILGRMHRWHEAFEASRETSDALEEALEQPLTMASTSRREELARALYRQLDVVLSLAMRVRTPAAIADACARTLCWKGAALAWSASQVQALAASTAVEVKSLRHDFITVRREIIRRLISGLSATEDGATSTEELQRRQEALDRAMARHLSIPTRPEAPIPAPIVSLEAVASAMPAGSALIEYVRYESIDFDRGAPSDRLHAGTYRYAAFILRPGIEPVLFDIGDAEAVERGINRFRSAVTGEADPGGIPRQDKWADDHGTPRQSTGPMASDNDWTTAGAELRRLVFDPLISSIGSCTRLYIAQHGELTRLPFAALPVDREYLVDRYELTSLDTGRDLLRVTRQVTTPDASLVLADPDFDLELQSVSAADRVRLFESLSGTREEGAAVAAILGVSPIMGAGAVKSRLRSIRSPRVLHIASHGFFLADDRPPQARNVFDTIYMIDIPGYGSHVAKVVDKPRDSEDGANLDRLTRLGRLPDPMLRSGLALAGSNMWVSGRSLSDGDDGLLTAAEIALLDFTSSDLVVLSACETGLGEVRHGEGVFGLRRAFAIAGAGTLVMSLWKIPDAETRDLMIEFYRRAAAGESFAQALRAAQRHVRETTPHPLAWGGLLCIGQPAVA